MTSDYAIAGEMPADDAAITALHEEAFGPGRFARAAERVREGGPHDPALSFVARNDAGDLVGSVRMTPIVVGDEAGGGCLLGPLAVRPNARRNGVGGALIERACEAAREKGHRFVLLVGDEPYYGRHGFVRARGPVMPGPVDPARLLVRWLKAPSELTGHVRHAARARRRLRP